MSCIDKPKFNSASTDARGASGGQGRSLVRPLMASAGFGLIVLMAGCSDSPRAPASVTTVTSANTPASTDAQQSSTPAGSGSQGPTTAQKSGGSLAPPKPPRSHDELRLQAAHRLVEANPQQSYTGKVPDILLAIPVLEVTLNRDGSIKRIVVLRKPHAEPGTIQLAIDALHRAAPYGDLSRLPSPWKFTETFLFNDERRFKPRTLD
ncbi:hypothetical protein LNV08_03445 [Paucibacter sp. TC2R-5]|uniref:hypothetical protein n=1 Tax=Paucibacter sp. TC2R-5 TaxID=2893555 RepID=UPI0021E388D4|nr:hypothetical protein [Paucibacter sp. TC2R-5]MCV2358020.1 hypothetical protein [Paucibacter sp. TC2R-5]